MPLTRLASFVPALSAVFLGACIDSTTPRACEGGDVLDPMLPGVFVMITDSITGSPAAANAKVVARAGTYADSTFGGGQTQIGVRVALLEGTYVVTVTKAGYQPWSQGDVEVAENECGVPVGPTLHARLQPE